MNIPTELWCNILLEYTRFNMFHRKILNLVSKEFNTINNGWLKNQWTELMNISINLLVTIAYFVDIKDEDFIDYLMGPIMISNFNDILHIENSLPPLSYIIDKDASNRLLDSVILSNITMGEHFGPKILGIETPYTEKVSHYRTSDNELIQISTTNNQKSNVSNSIYWLYIFEEICHYCKTYSYMVTPYYDEGIRIHREALLYDVFQLSIDKMIFLKDFY